MAEDRVKNVPDEEFVRRLQEDQSEADDASDVFDPRADDLTQVEGDTTPENT